MKSLSIKQRSKEWLEWRRNKITASDAPIIMGVSKFKTIEKLYDEKIHKYEEPQNDAMKRGVDLEPLALEKFEEETGLIMFPCVGEHEELTWAAASFDGITVDEDAICEIKCPGKRDHAEAVIGRVPKKYFPQLQHQMFVSGLDMAFYYSFDGENGITLEVKRDQEFIEKMLEKEKEFWQSLQTTVNKVKNETATPIR